MRSYILQEQGKKEHMLDVVKTDDQRGIYIMADGFSGNYPSSSRIAVRSLYNRLKSTGSIIPAIEETNSMMYQLSLRKNCEDRMSSTLDVLMVDEEKKAHIAHVGDGAVYFYDGALHKMTRDDSLAQDMIDSGTKPARAYYANMGKGPNKRFVRPGNAVFEYSIHDLKNVSRILMATDGIDIIPHDMLEQAMHEEPEKALKQIHGIYMNVPDAAVQGFLKYADEPMNWAEDWQGAKNIKLEMLQDDISGPLSIYEKSDILMDALNDQDIYMLFAARAREFLSRKDNFTAMVMNLC